MERQILKRGRYKEHLKRRVVLNTLILMLRKRKEGGKVYFTHLNTTEHSIEREGLRIQNVLEDKKNKNK